MPRKCLWDRYSLGTRLSAIGHFFPVPKNGPRSLCERLPLPSFFLVSKQGNWRPVDSKTSTITSTRFELKLFAYSQNTDSLESLILPFFTRKVSTTVKEVTASSDRKMIKLLTFDNLFPSLRHSR